MHRGTFGTLTLAAAMLAAIGCSSDSGPSAGGAIATGAYDVSAEPETVPVWGESGDTLVMAAGLNAFRRESGLTGFDLVPSNILYTAAVRHAGYLDSVNSSNGLPGPDTEDITLDDDIIELYTEPVVPVAPNVTPPVLSAVDGVFPIFYTHSALRRRVLSIVGGPDLLAQGEGTRHVLECYVIGNSAEMVDDVTNPGTPQLSNFRGLGPAYSMVTGVNYTPAENLWYNPAWRLPIARASTRWVGYGTVERARMLAGFSPPYPVLSSNGPQAFQGVLTLVEEATPAPIVAQQVWPRNGSTNVRPIGFDGPQGTVEYEWMSGPPLHVIFPTTDWMALVNITLQRTDAAGTPQAGDDIWNPGLGPYNNGTSTIDIGAGAQNIYVFGNTLAVGGGGGAAFTPSEGTELFYGTVSTGGTVGGGAPQNVIFHSNFGISYIDNTNNNNATADNPTDWFIENAYYNLGAPSLQLTTIVFEAALDTAVAPGDTIAIGTYPSPLLTNNPGSEPQINGFNDGNYTIVWISLDRTYIQVSTQPSAYDETDSVGYNLLADPGPTTNAACTVQGLRTNAGGGNELATVRNGEFLFIPGDPLIPGVYYTMQVYARTLTGLEFNVASTFQVNL